MFGELTLTICCSRVHLPLVPFFGAKICTNELVIWHEWSPWSTYRTHDGSIEQSLGVSAYTKFKRIKWTKSTLVAYLEVLVLHVPRHSQKVALLTEPFHLLFEGILARTAQVLERQICLRHAGVQRRLFCSNLGNMYGIRSGKRKIDPFNYPSIHVIYFFV